MANSGFTEHEQAILFNTERTASVVSLVGCFCVFFTFSWSSRFRRPVNRLILYATLGNVMMNVGTLISVNGILAGANSPLCQFQAFMIQMFLPADAFWNLSMAINTYLQVFKRFTPAQCKAMEKYYFALNYGVFFTIAFIYCFIHGSVSQMYGYAVLWCWISTEFDRVRLATCYVPAWCCILASFTIYVLAGRELFKRRRQFSQFRTSSENLPPSLENPFSSFKTTEVQITSELAGARAFDNVSTDSQIELQQTQVQRQYLGGNKDYEEYSITIERGLAAPTRSATAMNEDEIKLRNTIMSSNKALWGYTKTCILFFFSLNITWIPSSIFRVYTLVHPDSNNFGIAYAAAFVLPLTGFWNTLIYFTVSWDAVLDMFAGDIDQRVWRQWHGHWLGTKRPQQEWRGNSGDSWGSKSHRISLNSKEAHSRERYVA